MDPVNRLGAGALFWSKKESRVPEDEEGIEDALQKALEAMDRSRDEMLDIHQETVKKGLEENRAFRREQNREKALDDAAEQREQYFAVRSLKAQEEERALLSLSAESRHGADEKKAVALEQKAREEENVPLALEAREKERSAQARKNDAAREFREARNAKRDEWLL